MTASPTTPSDPPRITQSTAVGLTALAGVVMILILFRFFGFPEPHVHDEFAYLLGADTFLEGRLTNPTPPMPEFFETFHVSMTPTYHSKYPPAQSAFLALGQGLFGDPVYGVWLSFLLSAVALTWALFPLVPPKWALLGGCLSVMNATILMDWAFTYWGGSVAMLGGALFLGGLLRLDKQPTVSAAAWTSAGLFLLAFSRPLEGLITASIPLLAYLCTLPPKWNDPDTKQHTLKVLAILFGAGVLILGLNLAYNHHLTGSALTFPHQHWSKADSVHPIINSYRGSDPTPVGSRILRLTFTFIRPSLWVLVALSLFPINRKYLIGLGTVAILILYSSVTSRAWPHYIAPAVPILFGLAVMGGRALSGLDRHTPRIRNTLLAVLLTLYAGYEIRRLALEAPQRINPNLARDFGHLYKQDIDDALAQDPGNHLVFTRYLQGHNISYEYVYNRADIPNATVIWAREMSAEKNQQLLDAYPNRTVWLLKIRSSPVQLLPVEAGGPTSIP